MNIFHIQSYDVTNYIKKLNYLIIYVKQLSCRFYQTLSKTFWLLKIFKNFDYQNDNTII